MGKYEHDYVKELYKVLGIESDYQPEFKDGNAKYREGGDKGGGGKEIGERAGSIGRKTSSMNEDWEEEEEWSFTGRYSELILPMSLGFLVTSCLVGIACMVGFWWLVFRHFFRLTISRRKG